MRQERKRRRLGKPCGWTLNWKNGLVIIEANVVNPGRRATKYLATVYQPSIVGDCLRRFHPRQDLRLHVIGNPDLPAKGEVLPIRTRHQPHDHEEGATTCTVWTRSKGSSSSR
jgi:hypothetical protein